jgi:hypothetical protein
MKISAYTDHVISKPQAKKPDTKLEPTQVAASKPTVSISSSAKDMQAISTRVSDSYGYVNKHPLSFLTRDKVTEILAGDVRNAAKEMGTSLSDKQINHVVFNIKDNLNLESHYAKVGSIYDRNDVTFLTKEDRELMDKAYQYAKDNGTNMLDVRRAGWALSDQRLVESWRANGTGMHPGSFDTGLLKNLTPEDEFLSKDDLRDKYLSEIKAIRDAKSVAKFDDFKANPFFSEKRILDAVTQEHYDVKELSLSTPKEVAQFKLDWANRDKNSVEEATERGGETGNIDDLDKLKAYIINQMKIAINPLDLMSGSQANSLLNPSFSPVEILERFQKFSAANAGPETKPAVPETKPATQETKDDDYVATAANSKWK